MLQVDIPERELFDEATSTFIYLKGATLQLEHSLVSLSKWESKWCKPFLGKDTKTDEETMDYIKCMTITQNVDPSVYDSLPSNILSDIDRYINSPMTATWFSDDTKPANNKDIITAEIIYYWMIAQQIPMECQKWHLRKLLTLINVCGIKNSKPKKRNKKEMLNDRRVLNEKRKAELNTKG